MRRESYVGEEVPMEEISMDDMSVTHDIYMGCRTDKVFAGSKHCQGILTESVHLERDTRSNTRDLDVLHLSCR